MKELSDKDVVEQSRYDMSFKYFLDLTPKDTAIIDAIYNTCGVRIRELPATPEKVLMALMKKSI